MVVYKNEDFLYNNTKDCISKHLVDIGKPVINSHNELFIENLKFGWDEYKTSVNCIKDVLLYLDKEYSENGKKTVLQMGIELFKLNVLDHDRVKKRFIQSLLQMIKNERNGENIEKSILKELIQMLLLMGLGNKSVYESLFESHFLNETSSFYEIESQFYINSYTIAEYMKKVWKKKNFKKKKKFKKKIKISKKKKNLKRERVNYYLDSSTSPKIETILDRELIDNHKKTFLNSETGLILFLEAEMYQGYFKFYFFFPTFY